jgi:Nif-specific regulatory protein
MSDFLLDLLEAITEARIANPQLRPSVLAALRLASGDGLLSAGRLYVQHSNGEKRMIIAHGEATLSEEADLQLIVAAKAASREFTSGPVTVFPLGNGKRTYGGLLVEKAKPEVGRFLADLFVQWCSMAEFVSIEKAELLDENFQLRAEIKNQYSERNIVGISGSFHRVLENAARVAASTATVLIQGETGTGKELVARYIHDHSNRANGPFVPVNCGALSESLLESELFGHVKGAFTGATTDRKGRFEAAHGGTIFLDEIGEVSLPMQVRLLRVLQETEIERVGDNRSRKLDVRVVAATNRNLEEEVRKGNFRADLFYRLNVVFLQIPPLRSRPEDIPLLVEHFVNTYCQRNVKFIESVTRETLEIMQRYPWPGNVRELENCIEKMVVMAPARVLTPDLLPLTVMAYDPHQASDRSLGIASFEARLKTYMQSETHACIERGGDDLYKQVRNKWERYLFEAVLTACNNNKSKAAQILGITRNTLNIRLGELCDVKMEWAIE